MNASAHFVKSSALLSKNKLHLSQGDAISWDSNTDTPEFQRALQFYSMDAQNPMQTIVTPLRSRNLVDLVGTVYADFVEALDQHELFQLVAFCDFLHLDQFLNLCVTEVSIRIKGKSAAEVREFFKNW